MNDKLIAKIGEAELWEDGDTKRTYLIRGPFNPMDKHWGMRSSLNFRKILIQKSKSK